MTTEGTIQKIPLAGIDPQLQRIAIKIYSGERITREEGILLFEEGSLAFLGSLANHV
jgi:aminodeoxyfutalosine synthase